MFANLTVRARLVLTMGLLTLALAAVAVVCLYGLQHANRDMQAIYAERMLPALDLENIDRLQLTNRVRVNAALVTPTPEIIRTNLEAMTKTTAEIGELWNKYTALSLSPQERTFAEKFRADRQSYLTEAIDPIKASLRANDLNEARRLIGEKLRPLYQAINDDMAGLLKAQIDAAAQTFGESKSRYGTIRNLVWGVGLAALLLAVVAAILLIRAIVNPLQRVMSHFEEIEHGNYDTAVTATSTDELGLVLSALERMRITLKERIERDRTVAAENARVRTALDRVSAGSMVADPDGKIVYMNEAAQTIFRKRLTEIRKQLPQFDPERLIGSSLDCFQTSNQHDSLAKGADSLDMKFGAATLRRVANPVLDAKGERLGTVVQWFDRTDEVAIEEEIQATISQALQGDLTAHIPESGKEGFFAVLSNGMNSLIDNAAGIVRQLGASVTDMRAAAQEISQGNTNLSQRTEEQASSLEETASSMEEMTGTVKSTANNANQARQLASAAREKAHKGGDVVSAAVTAMNEINAASAKIAAIIGVIDEIAFQTNLLALNAAVEAARAGEQGRGFAVVAGEVRTLAGRSATAAKEIKALIQDSVTKVGEGSKLVGLSGEALGEIDVAVKRVTDMVGDIAQASQEQASGIEQVNRAVMQMDEMTQQNAALVEEAAAASQAIAAQASQLSELVARYRVDREAHPGAPLRQPAPTASSAPVPVRNRPRVQAA